MNVLAGLDSNIAQSNSYPLSVQSLSMWEVVEVLETDTPGSTPWPIQLDALDEKLQEGQQLPGAAVIPYRNVELPSFGCPVKMARIFMACEAA
jgi:hypothetical protein